MQDVTTVQFDEFYRKVGQTFASDLASVEYFSQLQTDQEKIAYLQPRIQDAAEEAVTCSTSRCNKDSVSAERCLEEALLALNNVNLGRALHLSSRAIRYAPEYSAQLYRAYAIRASVLSKLQFYEDALKDCDIIDFDKTFNEETKFKVCLARSSCLAGLQDWDAAESNLRKALSNLRDEILPKEQKAAFAVQLASQMKSIRIERTEKRENVNRKRASAPSCPPLLSAPHPDIPNVCDALEMRITPEKGRHLIANRVIEPGSVLIVDEPFAWMLVPSVWDDHCSYCCRPVLSSVPCYSCAAICFCDTTCREAAWSSFHRWECGILDHFTYTKELSTMALLVLRIIARAGVDTLLQPENETSYNNAYLQETNSSKRPVGDMIKRAITAIFLEKCLEKTGFCTSPNSLLVANALFRHLQSCSCNAYEITEHVLTGDRSEDIAIGGALYASISLANHACNNNVARHSYGRKCVVRALRTINTGEEILDNYGYSYLSCPKAERQICLRRQYFFTCACEACVNNWPLFTNLTSNTHCKCPQCKKTLIRLVCHDCNSKKQSKIIENKIKTCLANYQKVIQNLAATDIEENIALLKNDIKILNKWVVEPNKELIKCQQALLRCWSLLGNVNDTVVDTHDNY